MANEEAEGLFSELAHFVKTGHFADAVGVCDNLLKLDGNDQDAFVYKVVCLIESKDFDRALATMHSKKALAKGLDFERAYCLYRLARYDDALKAIRASASKEESRFVELEAQTCFRMEDYTGSIKLFEALLKDPDFNGNEAEVRTNLMAAYVGARTEQPDMKSTGSFEELYNTACWEVAVGHNERARELLVESERVAVDVLTNEGLIQDEIDEEISAIRVQHAYILQLERQAEKAVEILDAVLEQKADEVTLAIANNNKICLKGDKDLFHSYNKVQKTFKSGAVESKMTAEQRHGVAFNRALILMHMKKSDQCRSLVQTLQKDYPDSDMPSIISAALHVREKNVDKARDLLKAYRTSHPDGDHARVTLCLAQLHLMHSQPKRALGVLQDAADHVRYQPAVVATVVALMEHFRLVAEGSAFLDAAARYWGEQAGDETSPATKSAKAVTKERASYYLRHGMESEAIETFENLVRLDRSDQTSLASLIIALASSDPAKAEEFQRQLPPVEVSGDIDAAALEESFEKRRPKRTKVATEAIAKNEEQVRKPKKKKKRKPRLPKDPTAPLDPERWIPKKDRTKRVGKGRKKKNKGGAKGVQGGQKESESAKYQVKKTEKKEEDKQPVQQPRGKGKKKGKRR